MTSNQEYNSNSTPKNLTKQGKASFYSFFFGGLLPVIAFTVIEEKYGVIPGIIAGMIFGTGEIVFEYIKLKKVSGITWFGNILILIMGALSLNSENELWFKLQPAIMEGVFAVALIGSVLIKKPFLLLMAKKQNQNLPEAALANLVGMTFRLGLFFALHAALATWAALSWSTTAWATLKGAGVMISFFIYLALELLFLRLKTKRMNKPE